MRILGLFLLLAGLCGAPFPAQAAEQPSEFTVALVPGRASPVAVRVSAKTAITSCGKVSALQASISRDGNFIDINTGGYTVTPPEPGTCTHGLQVPSATFDLPPEELAYFNVTQIRFWGGPFMDAYAVTMTKDSMRLTPPALPRLFAPQVPDQLTLSYGTQQPRTAPEGLKVAPKGLQGPEILKNQPVLVEVRGYPDADVTDSLRALLENRGITLADPIRTTPGQILKARGIDTGGQYAAQARYNGPVHIGQVEETPSAPKPLDQPAPERHFDVYVSVP